MTPDMEDSLCIIPALWSYFSQIVVAGQSHPANILGVALEVPLELASAVRGTLPEMLPEIR